MFRTVQEKLRWQAKQSHLDWGIINYSMSRNQSDVSQTQWTFCSDNIMICEALTLAITLILVVTWLVLNDRLYN